MWGDGCYLNWWFHNVYIHQNITLWSSHCGARGSVASLQSQDAGWIPGPAQWVNRSSVASTALKALARELPHATVWPYKGGGVPIYFQIKIPLMQISREKWVFSSTKTMITFTIIYFFLVTVVKWYMLPLWKHLIDTHYLPENINYSL